jgi:L-lysine exporter family protein LysE/ArgO
VAIGAQNAFVLRQGLRQELVGPVVTICAASDAVLILAGVAGLGALVAHAPDMLTLVRVFGGVFLLGYAVLAARRAMAPGSLRTDTGPRPTSRWQVLATCVALTWLNPHVYLDTVLLLGSVAASQGADRWWFALGATSGSVLWFSGLGYGARVLRPMFARPAAWRMLDVLVAATMTAIGVSLLV